MGGSIPRKHRAQESSRCLFFLAAGQRYRPPGKLSAMRSAVDIAGIRGRLLVSPAPGSLAGPAGSLGSGYPMAGPQPAAPGSRRCTRTGRKSLPRSSGWMGGWAWKGPGHPVDNGDQARGQRDGFRSEGAARVLFSLRGRAENRARRRFRHESEGRFVICGEPTFPWRQATAAASGKSRSVGEGQRRGYHGLHRP